MAIKKIQLGDAIIPVRDAESYPHAAGHIVCIGDSYLEGYNIHANVVDWGTKLGKLLKRPVHRYALGGTGFAASFEGATFATLLNNAVNDMNYNHDDVGLVIFGGGYNDSEGEGARYDSIVYNARECITVARQAFPNAEIMIVYMANSSARNYGERVLMSGYALQWGRKAYADACKAYGATFLDVHKAIRGQYLISDDGLHPSELGQGAIASSIAARKVVTYTTGNAPFPGGGFFYWGDGDLHLNFADGASPITYLSPISPVLNGSTAVASFDLSGSGFICNTEWARYPVNCFIKTESNRFYNCACNLKFQRGTSNLLVYPICINAEGSEYVRERVTYVRCFGIVDINPEMS